MKKMSDWNKKLTISWLFIVLFVSVTAFCSGILYDSSEDYNKAYTNGFFDGFDYQAFYLQTSGRICYYANVTDIIERKGYDEFGKYRFISDIGKEDGLKVADKPGFYYKLSYREQPKQTELEDFSYYLNTSSVNISCENNLSFYSEDHNEKYEFKCVDGGVRVFLPKFNLTKNTTMWMYYGDEPMNLRRIVTVTPYQLYEEIIYDDFEEYANWSEVI